MYSDLRQRIYVLVIFQLLASSILVAHPMPNTMVHLMSTPSSISGIARMPLSELEIAIKDTLHDFNEQAFKTYFVEHIKVNDIIQQWTTIIDSISLSSSNDKDIGDYKEVSVFFRLMPPNHRVSRAFDLHYTAIIHEIVTHQAMIYLSSDWSSGLLHQSNPIPLGIVAIDTRSNTLSPLHILLPNGNKWKAFLTYVKLGMLHIKEGVDHLMFLLALMLPVGLIHYNRKWNGPQDWKKSLKNIIYIISAFTIGHSITLAIGTFSTDWIPMQWIEILIAISILISAIHALKPIFADNEKIVALLFGLLHGLAFSTTIAKLDLSVNQLVISLFAFNMGIEIMQLAIMLILIPFLLLMSQYRLYKHIRVFGAIVCIMAALAWIVERWSSEQNAISNAFDALHHHSVYIIMLFAILTAATTILSQRSVHKNFESKK